jgi:hypothetical protein
MGKTQGDNCIHFDGAGKLIGGKYATCVIFKCIKPQVLKGTILVKRLYRIEQCCGGI